eukprot:scaffold3319_cov110-Isochrysis_galbana.AAC.4
MWLATAAVVLFPRPAPLIYSFPLPIPRSPATTPWSSPNPPFHATLFTHTHLPPPFTGGRRRPRGPLFRPVRHLLPAPAGAAVRKRAHPRRRCAPRRRRRRALAGRADAAAVPRRTWGRGGRVPVCVKRARGVGGGCEFGGGEDSGQLQPRPRALVGCKESGAAGRFWLERDDDRHAAGYMGTSWVCRGHTACFGRSRSPRRRRAALAFVQLAGVVADLPSEADRGRVCCEAVMPWL